MTYPIDVVFMDREGYVLQVDVNVPPWKMRTRWLAKAVLELPASQAVMMGIATGSRLKLRT
jgi:uncharacterized membrane protein (UPF0127 family)